MAGRPRDPNSKRVRVNLRSHALDVKTWKRAAKLAGAESLTAWIEGQLNLAAKRVLRK